MEWGTKLDRERTGALRFGGRRGGAGGEGGEYQGGGRGDSGEDAFHGEIDRGFEEKAGME